MHAEKTEQAKPDIQKDEYQERLNCECKPRIPTQVQVHSAEIRYQGNTQVIPPLSPSVQIPLQPSVMSTMAPKSTTRGGEYGFFP